MNDAAMEHGSLSDDLQLGNGGEKYKDGGWFDVDEDEGDDVPDISHEGGEYEQLIETIMEDVITVS